jgi:transcriptional regulator with XRE-family HTH domain
MMATIGEVVRRLRKEKKITQRELENLTQGAVSRGYVANLERGKIRMPSEEKLQALAHALGVTRRYILEQAGMIEPVDIADRYIVELADIFAELTDEEKEEVLAGARWKAERKKGHQAGGVQRVG